MSLRRLPAIFAVGLVLAAVGPARAQPVVPPPSWLGVTLEMPAAGLREIFGDPVRVTKLPDELPPGQATGGVPERKARYIISVQPPVFAIISERRGAVVGIEAYSPGALAAELPAITDPSGVPLGATEEAVLKAHPDARRMTSSLGPILVATISERYLASYAFEGERLNAITWFARASTDPPGEGPPLADRSGDSTATAVLIVAKNELDGIGRETMWMRFHPCSGTTPWSKRQVTTLHDDGRRVYDKISYLCPPTGATRDVFFDITSFFGKY